MLDRNGNKEMIEAISLLAKEKGINKEVLFTAVEEALKNAYKNNFNRQSYAPAPRPDGAGEDGVRYRRSQGNTNIRVELDRQTGAVHIYARKTVVQEVEDDANEISLAEARQILPTYEEDDIVEVEVTPKDFRRVAAQTAKQVFMQKLRDAEKGKIYDEYIEHENEILTAIVYSVDPETRAVNVELGKTQGILDAGQQMAIDTYVPGERFKVYVMEVLADSLRPGAKRGPQVSVSRVHPGLVKRLFELEVPEIANGAVIIRSIAREAGSRTKIAVSASPKYATIDPVGSCVGPRGQRVDRIVTELRGEKIDIIKWSQNTREFVANALNPAHVIDVIVSDNEKMCTVVVPDAQLSLAIGKEGQNARLAAKLTGCKIDIKSQSQYEQMLAEQAEAETAADESPEDGKPAGI